MSARTRELVLLAAAVFALGAAVGLVALAMQAGADHDRELRERIGEQMRLTRLANDELELARARADAALEEQEGEQA